MQLKKIFSIFLIFFITSSHANDSAGTTAAGGITFTKTPAISMVREELFISPKLVKVSYIFKNNSDKDITTQVFFPIPPYKPRGANASWDNEITPIQNTQNAPFLNFALSVQGHPEKVERITRAILNGKDITQELQTAGIPLNPDLTAGTVPVSDINKISQWQASAKQLGLLDSDNKPKWQKQIMFYWTQTFPAKQLILIQHQYTPSIGSMFATLEQNKSIKDAIKENNDRIQSLFGINIYNLVGQKLLTQWLAQQIQQNAVDTNGIYAYFYNINYILTTGANWGGPIKNFSLTITKPVNGIVTYNRFYSNRSINKDDNPETISLFINNFIPQKDLQVLYSTPAPLNSN